MKMQTGEFIGLPYVNIKGALLFNITPELRNVMSSGPGRTGKIRSKKRVVTDKAISFTA
jgi:hypothetical protein